jgi:hypothetical protein
MKKRPPVVLYAVNFVLIMLFSYLLLTTWWISRYDKESFNCVDMSYRLAPIFRDIGFDTKIVYGSNNDSAHCWLSLNGLFFDSTALFFSPEEQYVVDFIDSFPYGYWDEITIPSIPEPPAPPHPIVHQYSQ